MNKNALHPATCTICEGSFVAKSNAGKYCSEKCRRIGWRASWRAYAERNRPARSQYHKDARKKYSEKYKARSKRYCTSAAGKLSAKRNDARMRAKFPEKYQARQEVLKALRKGLLRKAPCKCGAPKAQAHHHDYSRPLDIEWLCSPCHRLAHAA